MRLLRLDLEKYGAFESRVLTFRPDARLHVVFGPNEAGKSSALSAVGDLLFGFGQRTDYAFRHATGELRLGALVAGGDGEERFFRRRKGTKSTLIDADDKPLRDDFLVPVLGALGRDVFERAFGLTSLSLRQGGEDLRRADGEAGASLFAAASGLRGLEEKRKGLDEEADALFRPQAQKRRFNEEFSAYETARKEVSASELGQTEWKRLNEGISALEGRHADLGTRLSALRADRARIERLGRARRAAVAVDEARRTLYDFGEAPEIAPSAAEALSKALDAADAASLAAARTAEALKTARADVAAVELDEAALAEADAIEGVFQDAGAYRTLQTDLPRVRREAEERDAALGRLAERLGFSDVAAVEAARPTDAARADLRSLIEEARESERAAADRAKALSVERERLAALERDGPSKPIDPKPLRETFAALSGRLRTLERRDNVLAETSAEARALAEAAGRLVPSINDLNALAKRPLPSAETIRRFRADLDKLDAEISATTETLSREVVEASRIGRELDALASGGPIASPDAIEAARENRRAAWALVRGHLFGDAPLPPSELLKAVAALETGTAEADRLADRAAEDAGRAARQAELKRRRDELSAAEKAAKIRLDDLSARRAEVRNAWVDAWAPSGIAPSSPSEMEAWRKDFSALLERRERHLGRMAELAALDETGAALRPELLALAAEAGLRDVEPLDARALGRRVEERLGALDEDWRDAAEAAAALGEMRRRLVQLETEEHDAEARSKARGARWSKICAAAGLAPKSSLAGAAASLAAWDEAPALIAERDDRLRRVRGIVRDSDAFSAKVAELVAAVAPDLADLAPDSAARRLNERLTAARAAETRKLDATRRLADAERAATMATERLSQANTAIAALSAPFPEAADLRDLLSRSAARETLARTLSERRGQLLLAGERPDEETLRTELEAFDPDQAPAEIESLAAEEERLVAEDRQVYAELAAARAKRESLGGAGAEEAAARQRAAGAALAQTARDWAVLKLASLLIGAAVERAGSVDRSPTLDRAGNLFALLTGGAFEGFAQDFEKDEPALVARRLGGERVGVSRLSEGTRDQFYLALRLAALEDYASRAEPAPFIGDDLFASFDDARTAHGLKALAEIGQRVQPILFTHHRAVVETARATLGGAVDVIEIEPVTR